MKGKVVITINMKIERTFFSGHNIQNEIIMTADQQTKTHSSGNGKSLVTQIDYPKYKMFILQRFDF
jgi:hypothetical protein